METPDEQSRLTAKYQATIPRNVRRTLRLGKGDAVRFRIEGNRVMLEKAAPLDRPFARFTENTLSEWNSEADDDAFRNL